jgi:hypothetical protein
MILDVLMKGVFVTREAQKRRKEAQLGDFIHRDYVCVITPPPSWATCR